MHRQQVVTQPCLASPVPVPPEHAVDKPRVASLTFDSVYQAHSKTVARWTARLLGPLQDFEDAMQEVFLVVKRRLPEFRGEAEVSTWLYEITVRVVQRFRMRARWWAWVTGRGQRPSAGPQGGAFVMAHEAPSDPHALLEARAD